MKHKVMLKMNFELVVVAVLLAEGSLLTPEICGLNSLIGEFFILNIYLLLTVKKTNANKKRPGMTHLKELAL